jgi:hypothetical protein
MEFRVFADNNVTYIFEPKEDITAYEVSILLRFFMTANALKGRCGLDIPKNILRHLKKEK